MRAGLRVAWLTVAILASVAAQAERCDAFDLPQAWEWRTESAVIDLFAATLSACGPAGALVVVTRERLFALDAHSGRELLRTSLASPAQVQLIGAAAPLVALRVGRIGVVCLELSGEFDGSRVLWRNEHGSAADQAFPDDPEHLPRIVAAQLVGDRLMLARSDGRLIVRDARSGEAVMHADIGPIGSAWTAAWRSHAALLYKQDADTRVGMIDFAAAAPTLRCHWLDRAPPLGVSDAAPGLVAIWRDRVAVQPWCGQTWEWPLDDQSGTPNARVIGDAIITLAATHATARALDDGAVRWRLPGAWQWAENATHAETATEFGAAILFSSRADSLEVVRCTATEPTTVPLSFCGPVSHVLADHSRVVALASATASTHIAHVAHLHTHGLESEETRTLPALANVRVWSLATDRLIAICDDRVVAFKLR